MEISQNFVAFSEYMNFICIVFEKFIFINSISCKIPNLSKLFFLMIETFIILFEIIFKTKVNRPYFGTLCK